MGKTIITYMHIFRTVSLSQLLVNADLLEDQVDLTNIFNMIFNNHQLVDRFNFMLFVGPIWKRMEIEGDIVK